MNQIKNFIEEGEKELKQEWLETADMANDFTTYVKMSGSYVLNPETISKWWLEKSSSRQILLIKMLVDMVESEKKEEYYSCPRPNCRDLMENCKHVQEWMIHNQALDTISSKLKDLYK